MWLCPVVITVGHLYVLVERGDYVKYSIYDTVEFEQGLEMTLDEVNERLNECGLSKSLVIMDTDRFEKLNTKHLNVTHLDDISWVTDFRQISFPNNSVEVVNVTDFYMFCCKFGFDGLILVDQALGMGISEELFTYMRSVGFNIFLIDIVD